MVTAPQDNVVEVASLSGCSGGNAIAFQKTTVAGQPWAVAMVNGAELDAYVLSRDKASSNGLPELSKFKVNSDGTLTPEGTVELAGVTPVSTVRAANPYAGVYQLQAFTNTNTAAVLFMSAANDSIVLTIDTTSNAMKVTSTTPVPELPFEIAAQETASGSALWVGYILASGGEAVTHLGKVNPTTGDYTSDVSACQAGILGNLLATPSGVYCAQGSVIEPPLNLQP